jgi:hypothetical protein
MLEASPEVERVRKLVGRRLMDSHHLEAGQRALVEMLLTLWKAGYITLEPEPPKEDPEATPEDKASATPKEEGPGVRAEPARPRLQASLFGKPVLSKEEIASAEASAKKNLPPPYLPTYARPTEDMQKLHLFRGIHPLYAVFLLNQLGIADRAERWKAFWSYPARSARPSAFHFKRICRPARWPHCGSIRCFCNSDSRRPRN